MSVILKDTVPPIIEVADFGYAAVAVYSLLYQSAYQDQRYDKKNYVKRKDCGGTTNWSHKGIANKLHMGKQKVLECIDLLLDNGFIQLEGFMSSSIGSKHRIYRVVHPNMLEIVREVMPIMPFLRSKSAKERSRGQLKSNRYQTEYQEGQTRYDNTYPWDLDDRLNDTSY